jgi:hypothetical protein
MERVQRANVVSLSAFNHPNVVTGEDRIPGAVTRDVTVRRINEWCRRLQPGERRGSECFRLPDFLNGSIADSQSGIPYPPLKPGDYRIMEPTFSYMVLGKYPAQAATALISKEWIARARSRWDVYVAEHGEVPPHGAKALMGVDEGEFGTDANAVCFRYGGFVEQIVTWSGLDPIATGERATAEYKVRHISRANVDATGVGAGVSPHMQRARCSAIGIKVASSPTERTEMGEFKILRDQKFGRRAGSGCAPIQGLCYRQMNN